MDSGGEAARAGRALPEGPTAVAWDRSASGVAWAGTRHHGLFRSDDGGQSWTATGLDVGHVTAIHPSPAEAHLVWVGTEPTAVWRGSVGGAWTRAEGLESLPSADEWSFPPRPETHHVRWVGCHPSDPDRIWVAVEAGALVASRDGGATWQDRVPGSPRDTHEMAIHADRPNTLRVSAGDGYFESHDGGTTWSTPRDGLEVGYLRSVVMDPGDPEVVVVSASSRARSAYAAGHSDGRLYRRIGDGPWERVDHGWPDPPSTIAPLLRPGLKAGELWAADERGVHRSEDGGRSWTTVARYPESPAHLRGLSITGGDARDL